MAYSKILTIINPASGRKKPIIQPLYELYMDRKVEWEVRISREPGDLTRYIEAGLKEKRYEVIAVFGGDGTIKEAADVLSGTDMPLCILPGGSGNVLAKTLHIPQNLRKAADLMFGGHRVMDVDIAQTGEEHFMIRISLGFEARMVEKADRGLKAKIGMLAYAVSSFYALAHTRASTYTITLDGKTETIEGLSCAIANSGNLGLPGVSLSPSIRVNDGMLDVIVIPKITFSQLTSHAFWAGLHHDRYKPYKHWRAKEVEIIADPAQEVHFDGDLRETNRVQAKVLPQAVKILVPADYDRRAAKR